MGSRLKLQKNLGRGAAVAALGATLALGSAAAAQTAQGQFTPDSNAVIQLHMPVHLHMPAQHRALAKKKSVRHKASTATATPASTEATATPFGSAAPTVTASKPQAGKTVARRTPKAPAGYAESRSARRKAVQDVLSAPASATSASDSAVDVSTPAAIPFSFDSAAPPLPAAKPKPPSKLKSSSVARPRAETASIEPPRKEPPTLPKPKADPHAGLTKKGEVLFSGTEITPQSDSADSVKSLAGELNSALDSGAARVELEAFGGSPGDKSSDARRLSLRRALAIRQMLIDKGVPANRIDVKALGGADDRGDAERVDVYLRGAS
jgi:outer membrane protein OmpA-like peptidoglycan-associated protein